MFYNGYYTFPSIWHFGCERLQVLWVLQKAAGKWPPSMCYFGRSNISSRSGDPLCSALSLRRFITRNLKRWAAARSKWLQTSFSLSLTLDKLNKSRCADEALNTQYEEETLADKGPFRNKWFCHKWVWWGERLQVKFLFYTLWAGCWLLQAHKTLNLNWDAYIIAMLCAGKLNTFRKLPKGHLKFEHV